MLLLDRIAATASDSSLLLQTVAWFVCVPVCLSVCYMLIIFASPAKRLTQSRCRLEADLRGPKEPCII